MLEALRKFGAPLGDLTEGDFSVPGTGFKMGQPPRRIDLLTQISGVEFAKAWARRVEAELAPGVRCGVIALQDLLTNKRAAGRLQDLADVDALERLQRAKRDQNQG